MDGGRRLHHHCHSERSEESKAPAHQTSRVPRRPSWILRRKAPQNDRHGSTHACSSLPPVISSAAEKSRTPTHPNSHRKEPPPPSLRRKPQSSPPIPTFPHKGGRSKFSPPRWGRVRVGVTLPLTHPLMVSLSNHMRGPSPPVILSAAKNPKHPPTKPAAYHADRPGFFVAKLLRMTDRSELHHHCHSERSEESKALTHQTSRVPRRPSWILRRKAPQNDTRRVCHRHRHSPSCHFERSREI